MREVLRAVGSNLKSLAFLSLAGNRQCHFGNLFLKKLVKHHSHVLALLITPGCDPCSGTVGGGVGVS
jgi:hypothetical protein